MDIHKGESEYGQREWISTVTKQRDAFQSAFRMYIQRGRGTAVSALRRSRHRASLGRFVRVLLSVLLHRKTSTYSLYADDIFYHSGSSVDGNFFYGHSPRASQYI